MPNHHPKPEPIKLGTARTTYATAYANRPPTKRLSCWSWKMCIHNGGKQQFFSLGRLDRKDVRKKMDEVYKEAKPKEYVEKVDKCAFSDLMELWYLDVVVPRLPEAKIRDEFKLSKHTVRNYRNARTQIGKLTEGLLVEELNDRTAQEIVEKLQRKYAPRTVQLHVMTLRQILNWAWKKQKISMQITVINKRPNGDKGYVNNRHTPTDTDVEKLLGNFRGTQECLKLGWG